MRQKRKSCTVELDLEETVPQDVLAKLYCLCQQRNLLYPEGIVFLLEEVCKPSSDEEKQGRERTQSERSPRSSKKKPNNHCQPQPAT